MTDNSKSNNVKHLVIIGNNGSGKTTRANEESEGYNTFYVKYDILKNHSDLIESIENFLYVKTISNFFDKRKKLLLFDDIDILISQDRSACKYVSELIDAKKTNIIVTCVSSQEKKLLEIKKKISNDCIVILKPLVDSNKYYFDNNIYDNTIEFFENPGRDISDLEYLFTSDVILITYIIYDNYCKYFCSRYKQDKKDFIKHVVDEVTGIFVSLSELENNGFDNIDWLLVEYAGFIKGYKIRLIQRIIESKQSNMNKSYIRPEISYTQITSRTAQECNIRKKIGELDFLNHNNIEYYSNKYSTSGTTSKLRKPGHKTLFNSLCSTYISNMSD